jgi:hypothetical protein
LRDEGDLGEQLLHHLGEGDVDGVIVNAGQLESQRDWLSELLKESAHVLLDSVQALNLLVVVHEHIAVHLVDKDLVPDVRLNRACLFNHLKQLLASALVICVVSVNHVDECAAVLDLLLRVGLQHVITWEVHYAELNVVIVTHGLGLDVARWQQEEGLVRGHLLEDDFGDGGLARSKQS